MDVSLALIVDDSLVFSNIEAHNPRYEVVIFANALNKSLSGGKWGLHKIVMQPEDTNAGEEQIIVKSFKAGEIEILYCANGKFDHHPPYHILEMFEKRLSSIYRPEMLSQSYDGKGDILRNIAAEITEYVLQELEKMAPKAEEFPDVPPRIHYLGITSMGLPIVSRMYDEEIIQHLGSGTHPEMSQKEYMESVLSAKCATIVMNTLIRAQAQVKSIQLKVDDTKYHFIYFRPLGNYTVELYASGNPVTIERLFDIIISLLEKSPALNTTFQGDLKPYGSLKEILDNLPEKLAQKFSELY